MDSIPFQPVALEHISLLKRACSTIQNPFSEHTAGNLFLYRKTHDYHFIQKEGFLGIKGISYDHIPFLLPLSSLELPNLIQIARSVGASMLYPIDESLWASFQEQMYRVEYSAADSDYLYERESFHSLSGRLLAKKKNLYMQFVATYDWQCIPLNESTLADAHSVFDRWYAQRPDAEDKEAMYDGLRFFNDLSLSGWIIYVDKTPVGVYYGEAQTLQHNGSTYVVHCSKALPEIKGLGTFLQIEATRRLPSFIAHLNWEQDLGLQGLRHAKYTFHPTLMRKKGRVFV